MLFYSSFKLHLSQQLHRLLCTALAASLLAVPICSHLGMAGHSDCKVWQRRQGKLRPRQPCFLLPHPFFQHTHPYYDSRGSQSAGQEQIKSVNACMPSSVWQRCWEQEGPYLDSLVIVGREQSERCWVYMKIQLFQMMWTPFHSKSTPGYSWSVSAKKVPKF